jgi:hypothetical protein
MFLSASILGAAEVRLVEERHDLEHLCALLDQLALVDGDPRQIAALLGPHLDVLDRVDLGDVLAGQLHVLPKRRRDGEDRRLLVLLGRMLTCTHTKGSEPAH